MRNQESIDFVRENREGDVRQLALKGAQGKNVDIAWALDQINGCCAPQYAVRANEPWKNGTLKVRGNEWHYGERAWFWTHTSFIGECRFFHNARFLG